jgi:hypothetical protein
MLQIRPPRVVHFAPEQVVHIAPDLLVHFSPESLVHFTADYSVRFGYGKENEPLHRPPVSGRDYQPSDLAVFPLDLEFSLYRKNTGLSRSDCHL